MSADDLPEAFVDVMPDWAPGSEVDVERALRGLERLAARFAEVTAMAVQLRADVTVWEQGQVAALSARATRLSLALEGYALAQRRMTGTKTFSYPSGSIDTKAVTAKVEVEDEAACIEWCKVNLPAAVKIETSLLKSVVAKAFVPQADGRFMTADGEVVPGLRRQVLPDSAVSATVKLASQRALPRGVQ